MKVLILVLLIAIPASAESRRSRLWHWSIAALVAGNVADAATTIGHGESNPILGSTFAARATAIKSAAVLGSVAFQIWLRRRHPEASKPLAIGNFAAGAALGGLAARNWRVEAMPR